MRQYPLLGIDLQGIRENAQTITQLCKGQGIDVIGVVKGSDSIENSYKSIADAMLFGGCTGVGDSRLNTIKRMREKGVDAHITLLRIPMPDEVQDVVTYADCSLNSELGTLIALNRAAESAGKMHDVILMADLGDLREGYIDREALIKTAGIVERELAHIKLKGVGTNLGCFGAIKPDVNNLSILVDIAGEISKDIGRKLEIVSGGATSTLPLVKNGSIPKGINHLRVGEGIIIARDLHYIWNADMPTLNMENYTVKAQIIEVKEKPSYPIGEIFIDAFGNRPQYTDKGTRTRALAAIGKRDVGDIFSLTPKIAGITVEGGSSDHLILDITDCKEKIEVGTVVELVCNYTAMIFLTNSSSVKIEHF